MKPGHGVSRLPAGFLMAALAGPLHSNTKSGSKETG